MFYADLWQIHSGACICVSVGVGGSGSGSRGWAVLGLCKVFCMVLCLWMVLYRLAAVWG